MTPHEPIATCIRKLRPSAKFVKISHSREFLDSEDKLGDGFFTAVLYDEQIDSNMLTTKNGTVIIENSYISSFAYNLFLCWLNHHRSSAPVHTLDSLLAHNFKKFLAEQIYRQRNCIFSRTLLLETLLFEQHIMVDLFAARDRDARLAADSEAAANLMFNALSIHELGHYLMATMPDTWSQILRREPEILGAMYERITVEYGPAMPGEFQCDAFAVLSCLQEYGDHVGSKFALRALVFAFAAYAAMYSARATAENLVPLLDAELPDKVEFSDISPMPHLDIRPNWAVDAGFVARARLVGELCQSIASRRGETLFGDEDPFPLPRTIVNDLIDYVPRGFDCVNGNARKMSHLVARALHGHTAGMEYIYLRSKTFRSERTEPLTL